MINKDVPITSLSEDKVGISEYVVALGNFIRECDTPITISIQGEWGSGKTSFMKMLEKYLCSEELPEGERFDAIWINTWELFLENNYEEASKKLIMSLLDQIGAHFDKHKKNQKAAARKKALYDYFKTVSSIALNIVNIESQNTEKILNAFTSGGIEPSLQKAKTSLENCIKEVVTEDGNGVTDNAFLIFVDDLDRLNPKMAVTLLEALKNLFDLEKCIFILAIDYDVVYNGVSQKYGIKSSTQVTLQRNFFDKIIQVPFTIPINRYNIEPMVMENLEKTGFFKHADSAAKYKDLINEIVVLSTERNPRAIKRLLNMTRLMTLIQDVSNKSETFRIIGMLLMAVQLSFPEVYAMIAQQSDLSVWTWKNQKGDERVVISDFAKEKYGIDKEWKEIIYSEMQSKEFVKENYYRVAALLNIYEELQAECIRKGENIKDALGIINVMYSVSSDMPAGRFVGEDYDKSSQTQRAQGTRLIRITDFSNHQRVLDIGCGNGATTIEMWNQNRNMEIDAFDLSESQIDTAMANYQTELARLGDEPVRGEIHFFTQDALDLSEKNKYDLIFSNATLHWVMDAPKMYGLIYDALKSGGEIAIHQGGFGTYEGLHDVARQAIRDLGLESKFDGFEFPAFYPKKEEMEQILRDAGFEDVVVNEVRSDEKDNDNLVDNFAKASLIFYKTPSLTDGEFENIKEEYYKLCQEDEVDKSSCRLYIHARKN